MPVLSSLLPATLSEKTALWHIAEEEDFYWQALAIGGFFPAEQDLPRHPKRRLERLAGRFLLKQLAPDFPLHLIQKDAHDKPRIPRNQYYFSISHSFPYVAVTLSEAHEVGIDIQCWHPRMERLADKFLSPEEQDLLGHNLRNFTLAWCAKEAVYKWNGRRGLDFIGDMQLLDFLPHQEDDTVPSVFASLLLCDSDVLSIGGGICDEFAIARINHFLKKKIM